MRVLFSFFCGCIVISLQAQTIFTLEKQFPADEARQAVAVDDSFFYAIDNSAIGKYNKYTGERVAIWKASLKERIEHLNSGIVIHGKLYCAQSNYPKLPRTSSIEIWDAARLLHLGSHSFGIADGAANWIDYHNGSWWVLFAHYTGDKAEPGRDASWTRIDKFDKDWRKTGSYVLPQELIDRMSPKSCSGGAWGPDGFLYVTGHDAAEVYKLTVPIAGAEMTLVEVIPLTCEGQGIAFDTKADGDTRIYTILRKSKQVVVSKMDY